MKSPIHQDTRIAAFAERQMRSWGQFQETAARAASRQELGQSTAQGVCYVAISREAGAAGTTVARLVGGHLGWEVYDANLLDQVAQRYNESRLMLDLVDETESNWVYDVLGTWMDRQIIPHEKYVVQVGRMIRTLARAGNAVFVGRGAQFLLPRSKTFAVRIVAPEAFRAERVRQRHNVGLHGSPRFDSPHRPRPPRFHPAVLPPATLTTRTFTTSSSMSSDSGRLGRRADCPRRPSCRGYVASQPVGFG